MMILSEHSFRGWVTRRWARVGWSMRIEPGRGSSPGAPDLALAFDRNMRFLELKRTKRVKDGFMIPHDVRSVQHQWHFDYKRATGMKSGYLVGYGKGSRSPTQIWFVEPDVMRRHYEAIPLDMCEELSTDDDQFSLDLIRVLFT